MAAGMKSTPKLSLVKKLSLKKAAKASVKSAAQGTVNRSQSVAGKSANPAGAAYKKVVGGMRKLDSATKAASAAGVGKGGIKRAIKAGTKAGYKAGKK